MHVLGAEVAMLKDACRTCAIRERAQKLQGRIKLILRTIRLTPAASGKLRGRLGFYTSLLLGRIGRGMMGPLIRRQYGPPAHLLKPKLKRNLLWRPDAIGTLPPRSMPLTLLSPIGAHSDAHGRGQIATRALLPSEETISTHLQK